VISEEEFVEDPTEFVLPESDTRAYTTDELKGLSADELFLARNEIYARHGRIFSLDWLQEYFESKSWYTPVYPPSEFDTVEGMLSDVENLNISRIASLEKALGTLD
jgi:hypothetical protein